jgi:hypothetical protein
MLVSREDSKYLAVADYDASGKVTLHEPSTAEYDSLGDVAVTSMAERADGTILLGLPGYGGGASPSGRVSTLTLTTQANGSVGFGIQPTIQGGGGSTAHLGISVAAGNLSGVSGDSYSVAVSDTNVQVLSADSLRSASADAKCQPYLSLNDAYAFRPVIVADLLGADGADEIVMSGQLSGVGSVVVFLTYTNGATVLKCPKILGLNTKNALPMKYGTSMAAGDFDGDGHLDLAVGKPSDTVFIYFGPLDNLADPPIPDVTIMSPTATSFGQRLATYQPPRQPKAQLLVADPTASVGQRGTGGKVMLFDIAREIPTMSTTDAVATLFDSNGGSNFGAVSLGGLPFNTCTGATQLVPWVSTSTELLTFFNYVGSPGDPRCFK